MDELRTLLHETWSKALLAATSAEEQAQALVGRVGHLIEADVAQRLVSDVTQKLQAQRQELQAHVQDAVKAAVDRIRLPSRADVEALHAKLAQLEAKIASLEAGPEGRPHA